MLLYYEKKVNNWNNILCNSDGLKIYWKKNIDEDELRDLIITPELEVALKELKNNKVPGADKI